MFEPVLTRRTFEEAVDQIAGKVKAGELRPGDRLPSERDLAARMRISRPTLREAVRVLADSGVVSVRPGPGGGMSIASDVVPPELVQRHSRLRVDELSSVLEARRLLEPQVARLAAQRASQTDLEVMERSVFDQRALVRRSGALESEDRFLALDVRFHLAMARATGNRTLASLVRSLFDDLEIARDMAMHVPVVPDWSIDVHERTLAAIREGDLAAVDEVMDEHLGGLERTWAEVARPLAPVGSDPTE